MGYNAAKNEVKHLIIATFLLMLSITMFAQQRETCSKCGGSGETTCQSWENCSSCNGAGSKMVSVKKTCPQCKGTTKMRSVDKNGNYITVPCNFSYCHNGYYTEQKSETCGQCRGKGGRNVNKKTTCSRCSGKGYVTKY